MNDWEYQGLKGRVKSVEIKEYGKGEGKTDGQGELKAEKALFFNAHGGLTGKRENTWLGRQTLRTRIDYGSHQHKVNVVAFLESDSTFSIVDSSHFEYNVSGQLIRHCYFQANSEGRFFSAVFQDFFYGSDGQLIEYCSHSYNDTLNHIRLKYDSEGYRIQQLERIRDQRRTNNKRYVYDEAGRVKKLIGYSKSGKWYLETLVEPLSGGGTSSKWFNSKGVQTTLRHFDASENLIRYESLLYGHVVEYAYTFDAQGNWTERRCLSSTVGSDGLTLIKRTIVYYD